MNRNVIIAALDAPELLTIYGSGQTKSGEPYLIMEFIEGSNLSSIIERERRLPPDRAIQPFLELCQPIAQAHNLGIIHRDIKPSNIIVSGFDTSSEKLHIVDFGIARIVDQVQGGTTCGLTQTGTVFGTPTYMSPEQCNGDAVDQRTDIYSLGCVMYEVLCGLPPFDGINPVQVAVKHINDVPPSSSVSGSSVSRCRTLSFGLVTTPSCESSLRSAQAVAPRRIDQRPRKLPDGSFHERD
ncbi:MAG: serine/threonine protein kinase [Cyanobacteria bacterium]|nr:serine/threonine protein kinase [Cyanobacteriota bacterium]